MGFGFLVSGLGSGVWVLGFRATYFCFLVSGFGVQISGFRFGNLDARPLRAAAVGRTPIIGTSVYDKYSVSPSIQKNVPEAVLQ